MGGPCFEAAGGSVRGTRHRHGDGNAQDAFHWEARGGLAVAVVTDGCSSGRHSEVGAKLGARLLAEAFFAECAERERVGAEPGGGGGAGLLRGVQQRLFGLVLGVMGAMSGRSHETLADWFLFAATAAFCTPDRIVVACFGDGVAALNGEVRVVGSEDNRPRYPLYGVLGDPEPAIACPGELLWDVPAAEVETLLLGTDGVADLVAAAARTLPGTGEAVGGLDRFWSDDRYFGNPDAVRRRLARINRDHQRIDWDARSVHREPGLLPDDTTLLVLRRPRVPGAPPSQPEEGGPWPKRT